MCETFDHRIHYLALTLGLTTYGETILARYFNYIDFNNFTFITLFIMGCNVRCQEFDMPLYNGLPVPFQILFWLALVLIFLTFITVLSLQFFAFRSRRADLPEVPESNFLWVYVVPALNEEVTIEDTVHRLSETEASHKIIMVIDDASDDATPTILDTLTLPDLHVLRRELPNARVGKAAALNAAWKYLGNLLATPTYAHWAPTNVIMVIIDADGRLDPRAPHCFARHFGDPTTGGVQSLVRIYNRFGWLTWAQDVEFSVFGWVYQLGRSNLGTANMGGNGQATRLAALNDIATDTGPWQDKLTEDQDLGVRLLINGWKGRQDVNCYVEQQGVSNLRRLYRQRTRWSQGGWQAVTLLRQVDQINASIFARLDATMYLLTPVVQTMVAFSVISAIGLAIVLEEPFFSDSMLTLIFFIALSFGPGFLGLLTRGKGLPGILIALVLVIPYTVYSWMIYPVVLRAGLRALAGRTSWDKTAREPLTLHHTVVDPTPTTAPAFHQQAAS